ncbi:MAG TPA: TRAP transporter large permease subunit [Geminicoccaceae bacterium]|nr:TRAP transporter large permease subunit [Geminicoccaceae bacterium]
MTVELWTVLILASLFGLLAIGVPIGFATGAIAMAVTFTAYGPNAVSLVTSRIFTLATDYVLIAVPMFVLMAAVLDRSGIARDLFRAMRLLAGRVPGALAVQTLFAAVVMAAMTGIIGSEIVLLGLVALPQMLAAGYDRRLAIGTICAGGSLGTMIPPSVVLIIYGITVNVSIGDLFLASFLPGLLLAALYAGYILVRCALDPTLGPPPDAGGPALSPREKLALLKNLVLPVLVVAAVMVSIYGGIASVSEAAAMGAVGALVSAAVRRELTLGLVADALMQTFVTCGTVLWLIFGATALVGIYNLLGGAELVRELITGLPLSPLAIVVLMQLIVILLGCFVDWIGICLLTMPIFVPIVVHLGFDPIWFGVLFSMNVQIGFLTPPFAGAAFYLKGVAPPEIGLEEIFRSLWPFVGLQLTGLLLVLFFPAIAMALPRWLAG